MGEAEIKVDNTVPMLRWEEESGYILRRGGSRGESTG